MLYDLGPFGLVFFIEEKNFYILNSNRKFKKLKLLKNNLTLKLTKN